MAHLDGSGNLDALVGEKSLVSVWFHAVIADGMAQASVWWNDGRGSFIDSKQRLVYKERQALAVGDFNDEGFLDVFAAGGDKSHLWLNHGDGSLQEIRK